MSMTTLTMIQQTSAILLPVSPAELDGNNRVVRFDNECVLIPERSRRPKPLKTYSLPLWKKRPSDSETDANFTSSRASLSPEETHVVFKVPIPRFISRSPSRGRSTSASPPTPKPLSPCLVYRTPSSLPLPTTPKSTRRTSLPIPRPKDDAALTVPLRACCADCVPITEECLKEGEQWQEKFSRGARRRRSASLDNGDSFSRGSSPSTASSSTHHVIGFAAVAAHAHGADVGPSLNPRHRTSTFALTVDEVDKRRKSQDYTEEELSRFRSRSSSPRPTPAFHSPAGPYSSAAYSPTYRGLEKEASTTSTSSSVSELSTDDIPPRRPKSSPIQEEDEDQLFPLPSPRRSPNNSPSPSKNSSPAPSPNASTSCLPAAAASKDSLSHGSSSDDAVLAKSLSRKAPSSGSGHLSPSTLHPPPHTLPSMLTAPETSRRESPPKPQLLPLSIPNSPQSRPTRPLPSPSFSDGNLYTPPIIPRLRPLPVPPSPGSSAATSQMASSPPTASPVASRSPPSPSIATKTRGPSFSLPAIKDAIKGAGVDVLKGVSSIGGGGVVG